MYTQNNSHWYTAQTNKTLHSNYLPIKKKEPMINHNGKKYFKRNRYMCGGWGVG